MIVSSGTKYVVPSLVTRGRHKHRQIKSLLKNDSQTVHVHDPHIFPVSRAGDYLQMKIKSQSIYSAASQCNGYETFNDDNKYGTILYCWDRCSEIILLVLWVLRLNWALQQDFTVVVLLHPSQTQYFQKQAAQERKKTCRIYFDIITVQRLETSADI